MSKIGIPLFGPYPPDHNQCVYIRKVECRNGSVSAGRRFSMFPSAPAEAPTQSDGARTWANMRGTRTSTDLSDTQCASQRKRAQPHMPNAHRTKLPKRKHTHNHTQTKTQYHHHRNHHQHTTTQHNTHTHTHTHPPTHTLIHSHTLIHTHTHSHTRTHNFASTHTHRTPHTCTHLHATR